jgi:mono/diheme cytochrome c family protein
MRLKMLDNFFTRGLYVLSLLVLMEAASHATEITKGSDLYTAHCAACHGALGISNMPNVPSFAFGYGESLMKSDLQLFNIISKGMNAMPLYQGILTDQEITAVIAYVRTLN